MTGAAALCADRDGGLVQVNAPAALCASLLRNSYPVSLARVVTASTSVSSSDSLV